MSGKTTAPARGARPKAPALWPEAGRRRHWRRPTFREFLAQIEHEFGDTVDPSSLFLAGVRRDERLTPEEIKAFCEELGVPAEDFGV